MNHELPDVQAGFRKGIGTRGQTVNIRWIIEKTRGLQKNMVHKAKIIDVYLQRWPVDPLVSV